jgi:hypothetical protein
MRILQVNLETKKKGITKPYESYEGMRWTSTQLRKKKD